jgi:phage tail-like protein
MSPAIDTEREDPVVGFHFALEVQDEIAGYFTECTGIGSENETITHSVVTAKGVEVVLKVPGRLKWGDITLKRGITSNLDLWNWRQQVEEGKVKEARRDGSIVMFNQELTEVARWNFKQAWPSKISGPAPKAEGNEIVLEEITIVHEYISRVAPG